MDRVGTNDPRTYAVIGAAMQVHRTLGCGFLEAVYQDSLALEFAAHGIPYEEQVLLPVKYRGERVGAGYKADFQCFGNLIVEIKAQASLDSSAIAQTVNYMRAAGQTVGILVNFGATSLEYRRLLVKAHLEGMANPNDPSPSFSPGHHKGTEIAPTISPSSLQSPFAVTGAPIQPPRPL